MVKVLAVYDSKACAFMNPFFVPTIAFGIRLFQDTVNGPDNMLSKHPTDFTLFEIAEFDDIKGIFNLHLKHINLGLASSFVRPPVPSHIPMPVNGNVPVEVMR